MGKVIREFRLFPNPHMYEPVAFHRGPVVVSAFADHLYSYRRIVKNYEYMRNLEELHARFKAAGILTVRDNKIAFEVMVSKKSLMFVGFNNYVISLGFELIQL